MKKTNEWIDIAFMMPNMIWDVNKTGYGWSATIINYHGPLVHEIVKATTKNELYRKLRALYILKEKKEKNNEI